MREIKFRAWVTNSTFPKENFMCYEPYCSANNASQDIGLNYLLSNPSELHQWGATVLMQYTGLSDKNGVEIYEGDIVRVVYLKKDRKFMGVDGDYIAKVVYDEKLAMFVMISDGKIDDCFETDAKIEVIGNIYEGQTAEVL